METGSDVIVKSNGIYSRFCWPCFWICSYSPSALENNTEYLKYNAERSSFRSIFVFSLFVSLFSFVLFALAAKTTDMNGGHTGGIVESNLQVALVLLNFASMWFVTYLKYVQIKSKNQKACLSSILPNKLHINSAAQAFSMLYTTIFCFTRLYFRIVAGQCPSQNLKKVWYCNPLQDANALPLDSVLVVMMVPILYSVVFREIRWKNIALSWLLTVAGLSYCIIAKNMFATIPILLTYIPISAMYLYDTNRQNKNTFRLTQKLAENERLADETHARELRHMIGNVAHDLKTVSECVLWC